MSSFDRLGSGGSPAPETGVNRPRTIRLCRAGFILAVIAHAVLALVAALIAALHGIMFYWAAFAAYLILLLLLASKACHKRRPRVSRYRPRHP